MNSLKLGFLKEAARSYFNEEPDKNDAEKFAALIYIHGTREVIKFVEFMLKSERNFLENNRSAAEHGLLQNKAASNHLRMVTTENPPVASGEC